MACILSGVLPKSFIDDGPACLSNGLLPVHFKETLNWNHLCRSRLCTRTLSTCSGKASAGVLQLHTCVEHHHVLQLSSINSTRQLWTIDAVYGEKHASCACV